MVRRCLKEHAPTAVVAVAVFGVALADGGYGLTARSIVAVVAWWAIILGLGLALLPFRPPTREAFLTGGLLGGLGLLAGLSVLWSTSPERSFIEFDRIALYLGLFILAVLAGTRTNVSRWADGLAVGIAAVGILALATRLFPGLVPGSEELTRISNAQARLAFPFGYWNALGLMLAMGYPLLLRSAVAARAPLARGLAVGVLPALSAAIFLTSSRGAIGAVLIGVAGYIVLARPRLAATWATVCAGLGSALLVAFLGARDALVTSPFDNPALTARQGLVFALLAFGVCLAAGTIYIAVVAGVRARGLALPTWRLSPRGKLAIGAVMVIALVTTVAAADPIERIEGFQQTGYDPTGRQVITGQLLRAGGGGRYQFWSAAVDQFKANPVLGGGAGSYEAWWGANARLPTFVRDAHSLWLETLGELGVVGLLLLVGAFGYGFLTALARLGAREHPERITIAALSATLLAWALAATIDWVWEFTVVSAVALACLGLLTGPATAPRSPLSASPNRARRERSSRSFGVGVAVIAAAWLVICAQASPLLSESRTADSRAAAARGDFGAALQAARGASALEPWSTSSYQQLALVEEQRGNFRAARNYIREAIDREPSSYVLWRIAARIETGAGQPANARRSIEQALRLNPRVTADAKARP